MSLLRFYLDEDSMAQAFVHGLRARGVDVRTAFEDGMIEQPDAEQLRWATRHGRALVSFNIADYCRLHSEFLAQDEPHAGLVLMAQRRYGLGEQLRGFSRLVAAKSAEDMAGTIVFLSTWIVGSGAS